ncbi:aspartate/glutamate racemase family protein [Bradyrhizobium sp. TM239]|uniref:aspartate/glutamate racemase family protein n=1 Tax=Bradyrhizobium sp. TM239 TaxID=2599802 RepID=UPI0027D56554|nr:aspartate/glutamate racemase family protein [Bradyrhizobium sp. TM239]
MKDQKPIRIYWQSFVDRSMNDAYLVRLSQYLANISAPGVQVEVHGMSPPDSDISRLSEFRCSILAVDNGIWAEEAGFDAVVIGHFQDPGLYELRSSVRIPVVGAGEASILAGLQLGRRLGLVTLDPDFEVWHLEQAERYGVQGRVVKVAGLGSRPEDFSAAFAGDAGARQRMIEEFRKCADPLLAAGADVIIPAGVLPGLLIAGERECRVDRAPVLNCASLALKTAELWAQLRRIDGIEPGRGPSFRLPSDGARSQFKELIQGGRVPRSNA